MDIRLDIRISRIFLITDLGQIDITNDKKILRNLNWSNPRILVVYR